MTSSAVGEKGSVTKQGSSQPVGNKVCKKTKNYMLLNTHIIFKL